jgi:murein L,D-transpeptidase YcbB/YkuD
VIESDSRTRNGGQAGVDDWLADDDTFSWPGEPVFHDEPHALSGAEPVDAHVPAAVELQSPRRPDSATVVRRRRILAVSALGALIVAAVTVAVVTSRGSGKSSSPPATTSTAQTAATTPVASSPQPPPPPPAAAQSKTQTTSSAATVTVKLPGGQALSDGDSGSAVTALQKALARLGYDVGKADGNFGSATTKAVEAFQKAHGLAADGVVGSATVQKLNAALAAG